ncbi:hypothetical protein HMPREF1129_1672 [Actinomyces naeslundii str. Howell 279]|uniref:Uncharacterized protein n=1 Tax=Actinomyces naeslundii (strain ATCC 12104 / DSM 43013 / CCUG 2238 / JCM 8349 / NCTC 10301 / Howell 279) TaxID=1115803 RepID=J2ZT48_ACTNH|nr:hypothetical protein HMPREF1129_1672 [Actinomyces naeslundii str. Howell 279]
MWLTLTLRLFILEAQGASCSPIDPYCYVHYHADTMVVPPPDRVAAPLKIGIDQ